MFMLIRAFSYEFCIVDSFGMLGSSLGVTVNKINKINLSSYLNEDNIFVSYFFIFLHFFQIFPFCKDL